MTKYQIEELVEKEKIMSMEELKIVLRREKIMRSEDDIVKAIVVDEMERLKEKKMISKNEIKDYIVSFSAATAQRQIEDLRAEKKVWGPWPSSLEKHKKTYYPVQEVAAVMYIQSHPADIYGRPSLRRILETRHG